MPIVRCAICRKKIDVPEGDFNFASNFSQKFGTVAKFRCEKCSKVVVVIDTLARQYHSYFASSSAGCEVLDRVKKKDRVYGGMELIFQSNVTPCHICFPT